MSFRLVSKSVTLSDLKRRSGPYYGRPMEHFRAVICSFFFFPSPNLSRRRLDVYHTSTHGVALV